MMSFTSAPSLLKIERLRHMLLLEYMTTAEIAEALSTSPNTARRYMKHLKEQKQVYVYEWKTVMRANDTPSHIAVYAWGEAKDAECPSIRDRAAYLRKKYRERREQDPVGHRVYLSKKAMSKWTPHCDVAASWIPRKKDE